MSHIIIIAGSNGSGKTTAAPALLRDALQVVDYVNADVIAQGLSAFKPEKASIQAGRIMLKRIHDLSQANVNFAFETTLASRTFLNLISRLKQTGYQFHLIFLWLQNAELSISRVSERVQMGGHSIPEETIRRRYRAGLNNFFSLYKPIANSWQFHDNSNINHLSLIASGSNHHSLSHIENKDTWQHLVETYHDQ